MSEPGRSIPARPGHGALRALEAVSDPYHGPELTVARRRRRASAARANGKLRPGAVIEVSALRVYGSAF